MILIKNGRVIDPSANRDGLFSLVLEGGKIIDVLEEKSVSESAFEEVVDASGCWVVPGFIDLHVHLREPGFEWKETIATGCAAAALGGFTSICSMPNTNPANHSEEVTRYILNKAEAARGARVLPIGAVSVGLKGEVMAPLSELREAGCVAFSDDGEPIADAGLMRRALEWASMLDATISCHEEDKCLSCGGAMNESPLAFQMGIKGFAKIAEEVMVARDIELARTTGARVHICHISSGRGVELVRRAKNDGIPVTCEVTPHHLILNEEAVRNYNTNAKMSPPLREEEERLLLIEGIRDGTIDAIASDHAPHELDSKQVEFEQAAFGILGLQTSVPLILELRDSAGIPDARLIEALTSGPARCFGLESGKLTKGSVADVSIVNPQESWSFDREVNRSLSFNSPFIGRELKGRVREVFRAGVRIVRDSKLCES